MKFSNVVVLCVAVSVSSFASAKGISIGKGGIHVGGISVGNDGVHVPSDVNVRSKSHKTAGMINSSKSFHCNKRHPNAYVSGVNLEVKITGTCNLVQIKGTNNEVTIKKSRTLSESGANNDITVSKVNKITVNGANSEVTYMSNFYGRSSKVSINGVNAEVQRRN